MRRFFGEADIVFKNIQNYNIKDVVLCKTLHFPSVRQISSSLIGIANSYQLQLTRVAAHNTFVPSIVNDYLKLKKSK
jgi:hypothetical protein